MVPIAVHVTQLSLDSLVLSINNALDACGVDDEDRKCIIYTDEELGLVIFANLDMSIEGEIRKYLKDILVEDVSNISFKDMIPVATIPKVSMISTPIADFLSKNRSGYPKMERELIEDLSICDMLDFLESVSNQQKSPVMEISTFVKPREIISKSCTNFVSGLLASGRVNVSPKLLGMINYHTSSVGEVLYDVESIACTRLELESEMQVVSKALHAEFVANTAVQYLCELEEVHDTKHRSFSEMGIVSVLYTNYVSKYVSVTEGRSIMLWKCEMGVWRETSLSEIWRDISGTFISYLSSSDFKMGDITKYLGSVSTRERIQRDLVSRLEDDKFLSKLNSKTNLIGMANGVYDTEIGILREALPADYISMTTGIKYNANKVWYSKKDALMRILERVFPDKSVLRFFIRSCASMLEGHNKNKLVYIWWGKGNNGKSMIEKLLSKALGDYATVASTSLVTGKRTSADNANPQLSVLDGKLAVFLQEPNPNEVIRIGIVKELSGGDKITARDLFKSPKTFIPKFKLVIVCNNFMEIPSIDAAFRNRLVVIPFDSCFVTKDNYKTSKKKNPNTHLMDTSVARNIGNYADVFLHILIEEYNKIKSRDEVKIPKRIKKVTKEYIEHNNTALAFIRECIRESTDTVPIPIAFLFAEYKQWLGRHPSKRPVDIGNLKDELVANGYKIQDNMANVMCIMD